MLIKIGNAWVDPEQIALFMPDHVAYHNGIGFEDGHELLFVLKDCTDTPFSVEATMDEAEAALIDAGCIENPYPEDEDPPAMTKDELDELRTLSHDGFGFLARDYDHRLYAYRNCPERDAVGWFDPRLSTDGGTVRVCGEFLFVSEHDAAPTEIAPLLAR